MHRQWLIVFTSPGFIAIILEIGKLHSVLFHPYSISQTSNHIFFTFSIQRETILTSAADTMGKKKAKSKEPASDAEVNLLQSSSSSTQPEDPSPTAVHAHTLERRDQARDSFGHMNRIMNVFKLHAESKTVKAMKIALTDVPRVQQLWGVVLVMEDQRRKNVNSEREKRGKADEPLELLIPDIDENELHQMYTAAKELARAKRENRAATLEYQEVKWLSEIYEYWPRNFVFDTNRKKGGILEPFVRFLKPTEYSKNGINKDALLPRPSVLDQNEMDSNEWICQYIFTLTPGTAEASLADIPDCLNPLVGVRTRSCGLITH